MLTHTLQWVRVEETAAIEAHTTDETVVKATLQYVVILALAMEQEETIVYIYVADGCTGFAISAHVWQLIVLAESLAVAGSTNTTGDVEFLAHNIVPDAVDGVNVGCVAGEGGYIGHSRIHIGGTHGVSHSLVL